MVHLTRLNGHPLVVNTDLLKFAEATPDTTLTLITGERLIVRETCEELMELIVQWRSQLLRKAWPDAGSALAAKAAMDANASDATDN